MAALVNSVNPARIAGQASAAYEICDELGRAPDVHCLPVGNAGNITAYWEGYRAYRADGLIAAAPRMFGFQAAGAAPLVHGAAGAQPGDHRHRDPDRRAGVLGGARSPRVTSPAGRFAAVTDDEILAAYRLLSRRARRCSSSRRRRRAWPGCCSPRPTARCRAGRWWCAR